MNAIVKRLERFNSAIPEFCTSHWLLRIPLALLFIQMGLMKLPIDPAEAESYGLSVLVWWVVPLMLIAGFLVPWPYNYYRLKKYGVACH